MPFERPQLAAIVARMKSDIEAALNLGSPTPRRSNVATLAKAFAGAAHMLHGHIEYLSKQIIPDSADSEYLERWASVWGLSRKTADYASGEIVFAGTDGASIPAGTVVQRADGVEYATQDEGTIADGAATVAVLCQTVGVTGNAEADTVLTLGSPIAGVDSSPVVGAVGLVGGIDAETDSDLRARLLARIQDPPRAGAGTDYEQWALEIDGVTRAFVFPAALGPGTVSVYIVNDANESTPIPSSVKVAEVQAYLDTVRPVTAQVTVFAPVPVLMDMQIAISPNTADVRSAIREELEALFKREAVVAGTILRTHIAEAISGAAGEADHSLITPAANFTAGSGEFPVLGTITFSTL